MAEVVVALPKSNEEIRSFLQEPEVSRKIRLGMLTPSSNTTLEPVTTAMVAQVPGVSAHFGRFRVTQIALSQEALGQFDDSEIMKAAELLADAKVDVIAWNGTSASWLGFDSDERLCRRIEAGTGIPSCTSVLAFREIFDRTGVRRVGLVTPYRSDVQDKIMSNWAQSGYRCSAERHLNLQDNFSFAEVSGETIAGMVRAVAADGCDAVAIVCTNLAGAPLVGTLEAELGIPVYDSIATTVWKSMQLAGCEAEHFAACGSLFRNPALASGRARVTTAAI